MNIQGLLRVAIKAGYLPNFSRNSARVILSGVILILESIDSSFPPKILVLTAARCTKHSRVSTRSYKRFDIDGELLSI